MNTVNFRVPPANDTKDAAASQVTRGGGVRFDKTCTGTAAVERMEAVNSLLFRQKKDEKPELAVEKKKAVREDSILRDGKAILSIGKHLREALGKEIIYDDELELSNFRNIGKYAVMMKEGKSLTEKQIETVKEGISALYLLISLGDGDRYIFDGQDNSNLEATKKLVKELNGMKKTISKTAGKETARYVKEMAIDLDIADSFGNNILA